MRGTLVAALIAAAAILVFLAERVVSRRRASASLVAAGLPRMALAKSALLRAALPAAPAIVLAVAVGTIMVRAWQDTVSIAGLYLGVCRNGTEPILCYPGRGPEWIIPGIWVPGMTRTVPVPWTDLAAVGGGAMLLVIAAAGLSLTLLRSATDLAEIRAS